MTWRYPESPVDYRCLDGLRAFDEVLANQIFQKYHRKHGGLDGIISSISKYDRYYANFNKFEPKTRELWDRAEGDVRMYFRGLAKATPVPYWWHRPNSSNSGDPYYINRREIVDLIHEETGELVDLISNSPERSFESYHVPPVVPYVKSVTSKRVYGPKTRAIWCFPAVITCLESMFGSSLYHLLIQQRRANKIPLMHGPCAFRDARAFVRNIDVGQGIRVSDWVKGDQQMPPWLLKKAFDILESLMDFKKLGGFRCSAYRAASNKRCWDYVRWYFINTPIVICDWLFRKSGGIPSGSLFTLLVWNICSMLTNCYLARAVEGRILGADDQVVCGDDNAARVFTTGLTQTDFARAGARCGLIFHKAPKSQLAYWPDHQEVRVLSSQFYDPLKLLRDEEDLFARFLFPQRWSSCREESVARAFCWICLCSNRCQGYTHLQSSTINGSL